MRAYAVYRLYDADNGALYVGQSTNVTARLNDHARKPWWPDVARMEVTLHATATEMMAVERLEICHLTPRYNVNRPSEPLDAHMAVPGLREYVEQRRERGMGWGTIAAHAYRDLRIDVTSQRLRWWYEQVRQEQAA